MNGLRCILASVMLTALVACGGGGGSGGTPLSGPSSAASAPSSVASAPVNAGVASILMTSSAPTLKADGTSTVTLTVYALSSGNAAISGATIDVAATNDVVLGASPLTTGSTGSATVSMIANSANQTNRTATVSASCSKCAAAPVTKSIAVIGASIALTTSTASLVTGGSTALLTATVKDAAGRTLGGVPVTFTSTDANVLGVSAASVNTNATGVASVSVSGLTSGNAGVSVQALGDAKVQAYSSGSPLSSLAITSPTNNAVVITNTQQAITVSAPGASNVTLSSTLGVFGNNLATQVVPVVSGVASAVLTVPQAGVASVTVFDSLSRTSSLSLVVSPPVASANKLIFSASQTSLPVASAGSQSSVQLTARAVYFNGSSDQSVANVPVAFAMVGGPGAGEYLTPALAYTNSAGVATAVFYAGNAASIANGITVSASIVGSSPLVQTNVAPSSNSVQLTIGGQALSVAFGPSSALRESSDKTLYIHDYSVQVTDSNNNPVANQIITLRMRPVAFSVGPPCTVMATYCSEDTNGNGSLDVGEDGARTATTADTAGSCPAVPPLPTGTVDGLLTPVNSAGGAVPSTVTTDAMGTAAFSLTYLKGSAFWIVDKLTGTVSSNGTESSSSTIFRLPAVDADVDPTCVLPPSPFSF